ncbi:DUF6470 family protein [Sporosarcina sp. HYO08]|uniref:DUF6470 family protein n=1 Tax=Sporosarcina sp. HYO08 TaxID=1759557 RepID=UPI000798D06F|nr:DUF6470 family protein [Sporosarcina sp. HYO08]KXH84139.1 hypothetical protein AU377_05190 [Sporosarcina sp. HYO08]
MQLPQLQIQTTRGMIGLQTTKPVQEIEQPSATLDLQQPQAVLTTKTTKPRLSIDTTEARADLDLKSSFRRTEEVTQYSRSEVFNGIARRAQDGRELMEIENGGSPNASFANQAFRQPYSSLNIQFIPSYGSVKVSFEPGNVDIRVEPQKVVNNSRANKPIHTYTPGKVSVELLQQPSVQIDFKA